ncbi:GNAT family N-acetyltransferase [Nocardioides daphniae]|uniref:N-acetyltransferase GCN5 n=1 Tax=Nocardioides daphniae TaxID=402297 RepID=A0ABQ1Q7K8_9ACTN|nr:GNAT family N-acetyltransferase [Nocardioides daphniae]GGD17841.1 N-acetyltransferase GCN5 [Nocardioides daphniae]
MSSGGGVRVLGRDDLPAFLALCADDPVVNVFADHRGRTTGLDPRWLGGEVWGRFVDGSLAAACHVAANFVPVGCTEEDVRVFARYALRRGRRASTLVGPSPLIAAFWDELDGAWGRAREERWSQPHMEYVGPARVAPDPGVRHSGLDDVDALYPACVAMYTEEVGVSPEVGGGAELYRARVVQLVARGWSFARYDEEGRVEFKAEVACASPYAAQVQGVWVRPDLRGRGLATAGMAAVAEAVRTGIAPVVSLYVNDWNAGARAVYEKVGFVETGRFATVMW